jgi:hypothetical protein
MKFFLRTALVIGSLGLLAAPAMAVPSHDPSHHGASHAPADHGKGASPGEKVEGSDQAGDDQSGGDVAPTAGLPAKAKAYGKHCQGESKKHVAGQKGTPFSRCVTAMAKLATGQTSNPRTACKGLSKKHVAGQKGTPFSRCVSEGAKLLDDQPDSTPS